MLIGQPYDVKSGHMMYFNGINYMFPTEEEANEFRRETIQNYMEDKTDEDCFYQ